MDTASRSNRGLMTRLAQDSGGNTLAIIAAGLIPLMAMVGGGVDMGRSYLAQTRLQQACDAAVLGARKKLGSAVVTTGEVPADLVTAGNRYFNINFRDGAYATTDRTFEMSLEADYAISGTASVNVPTTIMGMFGYTDVPLQVTCEASLNFSNTDIMFVLDTTGSMAWTNPSDSVPRIDALRDVVKSFHAQVEGSKTPGVRVRYGFLPYATNVNVGRLLKSDWVVDRWSYHGRVPFDTGLSTTTPNYETTYTELGGTIESIPSYTASTCPTNTYTYEQLDSGTNRDGSWYGTVRYNGNYYYCSLENDGQTIVNGTQYNNYTYSYVTRQVGNQTVAVYWWWYRKLPYDVTLVKGASGNDPLKDANFEVRMAGDPKPTPEPMTTYFNGCIEERSTYEIDDYDNVDLGRALDLDIDLVPTVSDDNTRWRPMFHELSFIPEIDWGGMGTFKTPTFKRDDYLMAGWAGLSACPTSARKLAEMSTADVGNYVDSLVVGGSTYHDIGMIWGGRMLSPSGIFADENADTGGKPTQRHMIFLTDGETAAYDLSYGTYGIEPLDKKRWSPDSSMTLDEVVERRFGVACSEVKKRNITVWVIGFGVDLNPIMTDCAGPGHSFVANDAAELQNVFSKIAAQLGDLRITK